MPTSPLIIRYTDADGNKMVGLAEWYYESLMSNLEELSRVNEEDL